MYIIDIKNNKQEDNTMKWNQAVKEEIIKEAKETAKECLIAGFSHSYGTAEEFEKDNSKMIASKNVFFAKLEKIDLLGRVTAIARVLFNNNFEKGEAAVENIDLADRQCKKYSYMLEHYINNVCNY